jgi:hypothetical protein
VHDGIEFALRGEVKLADTRAEAALAAGFGAGKFMKDIADDGIDAQGLPEQQRVEVGEGLHIVTALVYAWVRVRLPALLAEGDILAVEREMDVDFAVGDDVVRLMTRPDIVWRRKSDASVFIRNLKTVREPRTVWREQWALDMQTLTEPLAVDKWLADRAEQEMNVAASLVGPEICQGVIIDGLVTGSVLDYPRGSGKFYHNTPLLYAWVKKGDAPFGQDEWCISPTSLILRSNLRWVRASEISPGDELIGFDEEIGTKKWPKFRPALVTATTRVKKSSVRVITDKGEVTCSSDHLWPARGYAGQGGKWPWSKKHRWVKAAQLKVGDTIPFLTTPWCTMDGWDAGYIAGVLDGEGSVCNSVQFGQNPGIVLSETRKLLTDFGFNTSESVSARSKSYGQTCVKVAILGGLVKGMEALGTFRPPRLLYKSQRLWNGRRAIGGKGREYAKVLCIEPLGDVELCGIETSTNTMIVNGLLSHNSARYEWSCQAPHKMARGRCEGGRTHSLKGARKQSIADTYPGGILAWIDHLLEEDESIVQDQIIELPPIMRAPYAIERWKRQVLEREVDIAAAARVCNEAAPANDILLDRHFPMSTASGNCLRPGKCSMFDLCYGSAAGDPYAANYRARRPHHPQEEESQ